MRKKIKLTFFVTVSKFFYIVMCVYNYNKIKKSIVGYLKQDIKKFSFIKYINTLFSKVDDKQNRINFKLNLGVTINCLQVQH